MLGNTRLKHLCNKDPPVVYRDAVQSQVETLFANNITTS